MTDAMRFRLRAALAALCLACALPAMACINAFGTDRVGRKFNADYETGEELERLMTRDVASSYWLRDTKRIADEARAAPTFEHLTNLGVVLVYQHRYTAAIRHFLRLEALFPGRAETAANLGTVLELAGYDRPALRWIELGMARNRDEHAGTEWLHARILRAKIADAAGRGSRDASIAGVVFQDADLPPLPERLPPGNDGKPVALWALDRAFQYQLSERMPLVPAPDWVVANLLRDWATLNLAGGPVENAKFQYELAIRYGAEETPLIARRRARIARIMRQAKPIDPDRAWNARSQRCPICQP